MNCPNCGKAVPDTDEECGSCGVILSKWRAARERGASAPAGGPAAAESRPSLPRAEEPGLRLDTLLLFGLFLSLAGYYWLRPRGAETAVIEPGVLGPNSCAFSGEVLDIYRVAPIGGVRLSFTPKAAAVTDGAGHYYVKVRPGVRYAAALAHPGFKPAILEGFSRDWREAPFDQRVRAARSVSGASSAEPRGSEFECEQGQERLYNFALVPAGVTPEEQARLDAVQ